jgi:hypothetical protein
VTTADEARALLAREEQARIDAARVELDTFLRDWMRRHHVRLDVSVLVTARGNVPQIQIVTEQDNG